MDTINGPLDDMREDIAITYRLEELGRFAGMSGTNEIFYPVSDSSRCYCCGEPAFVEIYRWDRSVNPPQRISKFACEKCHPIVTPTMALFDDRDGNHYSIPLDFICSLEEDDREGLPDGGILVVWDAQHEGKTRTFELDWTNYHSLVNIYKVGNGVVEDTARDYKLAEAAVRKLEKESDETLAATMVVSATTEGQ